MVTVTELWENAIEYKSIFPEFEKIGIKEHEEELFRVLKLKKPTFANWNYMVGVFVHFGYTKSEMLFIFDKYCKSGTYNHQVTDTFIMNHPRYRELSFGCAESSTNSKTSVPPSNYLKPSAFTKGIDIINHFFAHTQPVLPLDVPEDMVEAAHYYYRMGYTPLPKHPEHKHPAPYYASHGIFYRNNRFQEEQIDAWEWKYGICLLGDQQHCYLDIDNHTGSDNGTQWLDEYLMSLIHSRHYERTASNGYHVFGYGDLNTVQQVQGIEIRGNSALIVTYPTPNYRINRYI